MQKYINVSQFCPGTSFYHYSRMVKIEKFKYKVGIPIPMFAPFRQLLGYASNGYRALTGGRAGSIDTQVNSPARSYSPSNDQPADRSRRIFMGHAAAGVAGVVGAAGLASVVDAADLGLGPYKVDDGKKAAKKVAVALETYTHVVRAQKIAQMGANEAFSVDDLSNLQAVETQGFRVYNEILAKKIKDGGTSAVVEEKDVEEFYKAVAQKVTEIYDNKKAGKDPAAQDAIEAQKNETLEAVTLREQVVLDMVENGGKKIDVKLLKPDVEYSLQVIYFGKPDQNPNTQTLVPEDPAYDKLTAQLTVLDQLVRDEISGKYPQFSNSIITQDQWGYPEFTVSGELLALVNELGGFGGVTDGLEVGKYVHSSTQPKEIPPEKASAYLKALNIGEDSIVPGQQYLVTTELATTYNAGVDPKKGGIPVDAGVHTFGFRVIKPGADEKFLKYWDRKGRTFDEQTKTGFIDEEDKKYFDDMNKPREFEPAKKKTKAAAPPKTDSQPKKKTWQIFGRPIPGFN